MGYSVNFYRPLENNMMLHYSLKYPYLFVGEFTEHPERSCNSGRGIWLADSLLSPHLDDLLHCLIQGHACSSLAVDIIGYGYQAWPFLPNIGHFYEQSPQFLFWARKDSQSRTTVRESSQAFYPFTGVWFILWSEALLAYCSVLYCVSFTAISLNKSLAFLSLDIWFSQDLN